ncbi:hypothetical protein [Pedobacter montanisoli]|uniref:ASCH domain-containing protein n=1 Tax=Pedobacter montanisoli TaxID=2923277 RepID=A0ABS9ZWK6_9SPHI|nr:hypothetical protein [Pedobacter montanisoli]MCJ0742701.1 hypothetical protein [Pedobacter montanisoli]
MINPIQAKPISFIAQLYIPALKGLKTQTRRLIRGLDEKEGWLVKELEGNRCKLYHPAQGIETEISSAWEKDDILFLQKYTDMPLSEAETFFRVSAVRAENLQEISNADCEKEGILKCETSGLYQGALLPQSKDYAYYAEIKDAYRSVFEGIYGDGYWNLNPPVWVYELEIRSL